MEFFSQAIEANQFQKTMATSDEPTPTNSLTYALGIDLGTTSVKAAIVSHPEMKVIATRCRDTHAQVLSQAGNLGNEQDVDKILTALQFCLSGLPKELLLKVSVIGVAGQMHGVMLWKSGEGWKRTNRGRYERGTTSYLYTWQDGRCTPDFLATLPEHRSHLRVATGQGVPTLFWLQQFQPEVLQMYDSAATIQDFVVAMLCGLENPVMSVQNAASWGYYDTVRQSWELRALEGAGFPAHLLPEVRTSGSIAGHLSQPWYGIAAGTPVGVALGDLQCSFLSRHPSATDAVLNISTSAQLAFLTNDGLEPRADSDTHTVEYFPYFSNKYLAVAASLTGGNVLYGFVKMLQQWTHELGLGVPKNNIWSKIVQLGSATNQLSTTSLHPETMHVSQSESVLSTNTSKNPRLLRLASDFKNSGGQSIVGDAQGAGEEVSMNKQGVEGGCTDTQGAKENMVDTKGGEGGTSEQHKDKARPSETVEFETKSYDQTGPGLLHLDSVMSMIDSNPVCDSDELVIVPTIYGERHSPSQRGYVHNITSQNTGLGSVFNALCRGVVRNLSTMMPSSRLEEAGIQRIVGSGTAVAKNQLVQEHIRAHYGLPLTVTEGTDADAAVGAGCAMIIYS